MPNRLIIQDHSYVQQTSFADRIVAANISFGTEGSTDPYGIVVDSSGNIYISDPYQNIIMKVLPSGETQLFAGTVGVSGNNGDEVVDASDALFNAPSGLAIDLSGNLYLADRGNNQIRRITPNKKVSLVAGDKYGASGFRDGPAIETTIQNVEGNATDTHALFNSPRAIVTDQSNNIFIADTNNHAIRYIKYGINRVSTVAGNGKPGDSLGVGTQAQLNEPFGLAVNKSGDLYIADTKNYKVKRLDKAFNLLRFSGSGTRGFDLGYRFDSEFLDMYLMTVNQSGFVYMMDFDEAWGSRLIKFTPDGDTALIREYRRENFSGIGGVAVNNSNTIYILETEYLDKLYSSSSSSSSIDSSSSSSSFGHSSSSSSSSFGYSSSSSSSSFGYSSSSSFRYSSSSSSSSSSVGYSSSSSSSSFGYSSGSSLSSVSSSSLGKSSSSSLGSCEDVIAQVAGEFKIAFISGYWQDWSLGDTACVFTLNGEFQGSVDLISSPTVYLDMDQSITGFINHGDKISVCKGPCLSSESTSSDEYSSSSSSPSTSSSSSLNLSSSSSLGTCEKVVIQVAGGFEIVFLSGHISDWIISETVCVSHAGNKYEGYVRLIAGKNIFIRMDTDITGIINNGDIIEICVGSCESSSSWSSSSFGFSESSSSFSSSSSSQGFSSESSSSTSISSESSSSTSFSSLSESSSSTSLSSASESSSSQSLSSSSTSESSSSESSSSTSDSSLSESSSSTSISSLSESSSSTSISSLSESSSSQSLSSSSTSLSSSSDSRSSTSLSSSSTSRSSLSESSSSSFLYSKSSLSESSSSTSESSLSESSSSTSISSESSSSTSISSESSSSTSISSESSSSASLSSESSSSTSLSSESSSSTSLSSESSSSTSLSSESSSSTSLSSESSSSTSLSSESSSSTSESSSSTSISSESSSSTSISSESSSSNSESSSSNSESSSSSELHSESSSSNSESSSSNSESSSSNSESSSSQSESSSSNSESSSSQSESSSSSELYSESSSSQSESSSSVSFCNWVMENGINMTMEDGINAIFETCPFFESSESTDDSESSSSD